MQDSAHSHVHGHTVNTSGTPLDALAEMAAAIEIERHEIEYQAQMLARRPVKVWFRYSRGELLARLGNQKLLRLSAVANTAKRIHGDFTAN